MNIVWLILVGMGAAMAGLFLGGACRSSGDASRCEECALEYRRRVAGFEKRILELEDALSAWEGLYAHHKGETLPWEEVEERLLDTDEQIHQDLLDADIAWNERYALDQAASLEA